MNTNALTQSQTPAQLFEELRQSTMGIFEKMEIAEYEIEKGMRRHPDRADIIYKDSFKYLCPSSRPDNELLYRGHCREIIERIATSSDPRLATAAELLIPFSEASLMSPLTTVGTYIYYKLFIQCFGKAPGDIYLDDLKTLYEDEANAEISQMRVKFACDNRTRIYAESLKHKESPQ
jgi:hypothetical protein